MTPMSLNAEWHFTLSDLCRDWVAVVDIKNIAETRTGDIRSANRVHARGADMYLRQALGTRARMGVNNLRERPLIDLLQG